MSAPEAVLGEGRAEHLDLAALVLHTGHVDGAVLPHHTPPVSVICTDRVGVVRPCKLSVPFGDILGDLEHRPRVEMR